MTLVEKYPDILEAFARNFCLPPRQHPDVWASQHVQLDSDVSEYYDPNASPYFKEPFRALFDNSLREICIIAPPGAGKTALLEAAIAYIACNDPGDVLVASKNEDLVRQWADSRLQPVLSRCKPLADFLPRHSDRQKKLLLLKHMFIMVRAANESSFQQVSVRWAIADECWLYDKGLLGYLRKRLHDRWNGRTILVSQAGYAGTEWANVCNEGDQYQYHWQCECGVRQPFNFDTNLKWSGDENKDAIDWRAVKETTRLVCPHCNHEYADTPENRRRLSTNAVWELTRPGEDPTHRTYTVPALANFRVSWSVLVREFLTARRAWKLGDREPWFQFVTQRTSKFWKDEYDQEESVLKKSLYSWRQYNAGQKWESEVVRFMTVDVQKDFYWVVIRAWADGGASRLLRFEHVMSEQELRDLQLTYQVEDRFTFIDSAFDTSRVYTMCARYGWTAILGTGESGFEHPVKDMRGRPTGKTYKLYSRIRDVSVGQIRAKLLLLASERLKDIMTTLRDGKSLVWEVPGDAPDLYLSQIQGELKRETVEPKTKRAIFRWVQVGANHAFDCEYVQVAMALVPGVLRLESN